MTTTELNVPLSTKLGDALVQVGFCANRRSAKLLLMSGAVRSDSMPLGLTCIDFELTHFLGKTIKVARESFDVVPEFVALPESELETLRRKFSALAKRLRSVSSEDATDWGEGFDAGQISAADAIEELLSTQKEPK